MPGAPNMRSAKPTTWREPEYFRADARMVGGVSPVRETDVIGAAYHVCMSLFVCAERVYHHREAVCFFGVGII